MSQESVRITILVGVVACSGVACATVTPASRPQAVLYRDLERIVGVAEATGWDIDRLEVDATLGDALLSVCRLPPGERAGLLAWLDGRIMQLGGPVDAAWRARGRKMGKVEDLLTLTRMRLLLARAIEHAEADCPFWIEPSAAFPGRQISDDRWQLELGGGGKGIVTQQGEDADATGGGAGRLVLLRHFGPRWSLGLGVEMGASAEFTKDAAGQRSNLIFGFDVVGPLVVRYRMVNSFFELEGGPLGHFTENETVVVPGLHVGVALGGQALRQRWFLPGAAVVLSWERTFPDPGEEPITWIKIGVRVSVDVDL